MLRFDRKNELSLLIYRLFKVRILIFYLSKTTQKEMPCGGVIKSKSQSEVYILIDSRKCHIPHPECF